MSRYLDLIQPFMVDGAAIRGRFVRLGPSIHEILTKHQYPDAVSHALGRFLLLGSCLSHAFKFEGVLTLQIRGDGPVRMVVVDLESNGNMRGYAQFDIERIKSLTALSSPKEFFGEGHLVLTIDPGHGSDMYQGVVTLTGNSLEECFVNFFLQSDQIQVDFHTVLSKVMGDDGKHLWQGGILMLQKMPHFHKQTEKESQEDFDRCRILMHSISDMELLNAFLSPQNLLFRLFHEEGVRIFDPMLLRAQCRCSRERVEEMLAGMQSDSLQDYVIDGKIDITCQFCNSTYLFDGNQFLKH